MSGDFGIESLKMAGSLVVVLGLILALFYLIKRLRIGPLTQNRGPSMRLMGTLSLAPKRAVGLIEVCDEWFIVGIGTDRVSLISKIERPRESFNPDHEDRNSSKGFQTLLQGLRFRQENLQKDGPGKDE